MRKNWNDRVISTVSLDEVGCILCKPYDDDKYKAKVCITILGTESTDRLAQHNIWSYLIAARGKLQKEYRTPWGLFEFLNAGYKKRHHRSYDMESGDPKFDCDQIIVCTLMSSVRK
eukprot:11600879-Ditylum_brightwellii.AAC.1